MLAAGAALAVASAVYLGVTWSGTRNNPAPGTSTTSDGPASPPAQPATPAGTPVLLDDDFVTTRRLGPQPRFNARPDYCRTAYGPEGLAIEAVLPTAACEYVLYTFQAPLVEFHVEADVRTDRLPMNAREFGIRFAEWRPGDPDSPLTYRGAVSGIDNFAIHESQGTRETRLFHREVENFVRAGEGYRNSFRVDVKGRSMTWSLNGTHLSTIQTRANMAGEVSVYLEGQGLRVLFERLQVVAGTSQ